MSNPSSDTLSLALLLQEVRSFRTQYDRDRDEDRKIQADHEQRIRELERGDKRNLAGDGLGYVYTTLAAVVQFLLVHKGP